MPTIPVNTRSGTVHFSYTISTPREASAKTLEAGLPTLLFIHPAYFSSIVYHAQFSDPRLRRFNLVTFDLRCSGFTTGARVKAPYESEEIARDVVAFMNALRLPPCHIVGLGTSTVIAIDLALHHASKCLSLCLLSPLGFPEYNPAIMEGVAQIHSLWKEGMANASNVDKSIIWDALSGLRQFGFNHMRGSSLGDALFQVWFTRALEIWGPDQESIDEFFETTLGFFSYEKTFARSASELKGIRVPVKVIQGSENIINNWPAEYLDKIGELLQEAGIRFDGSLISHAPHVLCVDHGETLNPIIHDFVLKVCRTPVPPPPSHVASPWEDMLRGVGYAPEDETDDELIIHHPTKVYQNGLACSMRNGLHASDDSDYYSS